MKIISIVVTTGKIIKYKKSQSYNSGDDQHTVLRNILKKWDEWLRHCLRMRIWNEWRLPVIRNRYLEILGVPSKQALTYSTMQDGWKVAGSPILTCTITNKVLLEAGCHSMLEYYNYLRAGHP